MDSNLGPRHQESRLRPPRIPMPRLMIVESKTIGTNLSFPLISEDISRTGLLLTWDSDIIIPFLENTILDLNIDAGSAIMDKPLRCLGKITRTIGDKSHRPRRFGVKIIQIETGDQEIWDQLIRGFEKTFYDTKKKNAAV